MNAYWRSGKHSRWSCSSSAPGRDRFDGVRPCRLADFPSGRSSSAAGRIPQISFSGHDENWNPGRSASLGVNFDYRPLRYLASMSASDEVLHAFDATGSIETTGGTRGITDSETLLTLGPRLILPVWNDRLVFSLGGGYAYAWYAEKAAARPNEVIYGFRRRLQKRSRRIHLRQMEYAPSATSPVTVGFRFGTVNRKTAGSTGGSVPWRFETKDNWPTFVGTLAFRFAR